MSAAILSILLFVGVAVGAEDVRVRQIVAPVYPRLAWLATLQGSVSMELEIGRDGKVESAKASGAHPLLMEESEKNIRLWTFGPFPEGTAFPLKLAVRYAYKLDGEPEYYMSQPNVVITLPDRVQIVARPPKPIPD